jgi:hypothetical protein
MMVDEGRIEDGDSPSSPDDGTLTRRRFIAASGVAVGAVVVWTSPLPFADAAIGQVIRSNASGPTGPTGPTGSSGGTGGSASTGPTATGGTGPTATSGAAPPRYGEISAGLGQIRKVRLKTRSLSFDQRFLEKGQAHWSLLLRVPHDQHRHFLAVPIGTAHREISATGEHRIKVVLADTAHRHLKRHKHADIVIDTTFVDTLGRRFAKAFVVRR